MASTTAAQDEFNQLVSNNADRATTHPEDKQDNDRSEQDDLSEEETYRNTQIDAAMRMPTTAAELKLPPASFDSGRFTGVKGVIADARSYETARKTKWVDRARNARRSILGLAGVTAATGNSVTITGGARSDSETDDDAKSNDDDSFLNEWRESRRRELQSATNRAVHTRKTSPSVRIYGRLDEVDAMGYLDAIEKVNRDTTVVVFVYDNECEVSATIEDALMPLVQANPTAHFVKVHYDDIEFDPAAVPSLLAYRNQGDLVANLTGIIEMMPDDDSFDSASLKRILQQHQVL